MPRLVYTIRQGEQVAKVVPPVDICHGYAHTEFGAGPTCFLSGGVEFCGGWMVVDIQKLSDALRHCSPEEDLRRDLERIIAARRSEIDAALKDGRSYSFRVPDGRQVRISPRGVHGSSGRPAVPAPISNRLSIDAIT